MTRTTTVATSLLVLALAMPSLAGAQASRRGGGDSGGGGERTSPAPRVGTAQPRSPGPSQPSAPSTGNRTPAGSPSPRVAGSPGARTTGSPGVTRGGRTANVDTRAPGARVSRGTAQPRLGPSPRDYRGTTIYYYGSPWYRSSSYLGGFGYYNYYDPWYYGGLGRLGWGGYGYRYWHDPFLYGGSYYGPWPYYWDQGGYRTDRDDEPSDVATGSLRLKVSPRTASVYVDGALAGIVDEFDGLTSHLRLPVGSHQIELRADGFTPVTLDVTIEKGKTRTERANLIAR